MLKNNVDPFYAIGDVSRREILMLLKNEKQSINSLAENFAISRPAVSKHIKILTEAGFIRIEEVGRERFCELDTKGFDEIKNWIEFYEGYWNFKVKSLGMLLDEKVKEKSSSKKKKPRSTNK
jgi:DNA-binding transcriptional ArsR family regulator